MPKEVSPAAKAIGAEMRRIRKSRGWTQPELAEVLGLSLNYTALIERGQYEPSVVVLLRIARRLGTTVGALLGEVGPQAEADPWLDEAYELVRAVPDSARPTTIAMLRGVATMPSEPVRKPRARRKKS